MGPVTAKAKRTIKTDETLHRTRRRVFLEKPTNKETRDLKNCKTPKANKKQSVKGKFSASKKDTSAKSLETESQAQEQSCSENVEEISIKQSLREDSKEKASSSSDSDSFVDDGAQDDDDDSDFDPDNDPEKLWCFCKEPHSNRFMICCDVCEDWFHGECVGITIQKGREMEKTGEEWCCKKCTGTAAESVTIKEELKSSPLNSVIVPPVNCNISFSLDNLKINLKKQRQKSDASKDNEKLVVSQQEENTKPHTVPPEASAELSKEPHKIKRKDSLNVNSFDIIQFEQLPVKKQAPQPVKIERSERKSSDEYKAKIKVRTTPTPTKDRAVLVDCIRESCSYSAMKASLYCSRECIYKYATEAIKAIEEEKYSGKSKDKKGISPAKEIAVHRCGSPLLLDNNIDEEGESTNERVAVFEKSTGKVVAGVMAPMKKYLFAWLEEHPTFEVLKQSKQAIGLTTTKKDQDNIVRSNVRHALRMALVSRCKSENLVALKAKSINHLCQKIESALLKLFGETSQKYKSKYRSLIFNLKDKQNKILYKRVISGEISPHMLVRMSPEQLATPELSRWREQETKHHLEMVKKREEEEALLLKNPQLKQTHKGEVEIIRDKEDLGTLEIKHEPTVQVTSVEKHVDVASLLKDTTEEHSNHLFDANCKICTGQMTPPGESQITTTNMAIMQPDPDFQAVSPERSKINFVSHSPILSPPPTEQMSVWRGFVMMQKVSRFVTTAYSLSGSTRSLMEILPGTLTICGRIAHQQVWEYLSQLKGACKNKFIDVIRLEISTQEEKAGYIKLYTYFYTRQRIGVVENCSESVKDMYILPLASHDRVPYELQPLPGLPTPRPHMLLGVIVRTKPSPRIERLLSSPDPVVVKKKKKKKKKEKVFVEVQLDSDKKLTDFIFQSKVDDIIPSTLIDLDEDEGKKPPEESPKDGEKANVHPAEGTSGQNRKEQAYSKDDHSTNNYLVNIPDPASMAKSLLESVLGATTTNRTTHTETSMEKIKETPNQDIPLLGESAAVLPSTSTISIDDANDAPLQTNDGISVKVPTGISNFTPVSIPPPIPGSIPLVPLPPNIINFLPPGVPLPPLPPQRPSISPVTQLSPPREEWHPERAPREMFEPPIDEPPHFHSREPPYKERRFDDNHRTTFYNDGPMEGGFMENVPRYSPHDYPPPSRSYYEPPEFRPDRQPFRNRFPQFHDTRMSFNPHPPPPRHFEPARKQFRREENFFPKPFDHPPRHAFREPRFHPRQHFNRGRKHFHYNRYNEPSHFDRR